MHDSKKELSWPILDQANCDFIYNKKFELPEDTRPQLLCYGGGPEAEVDVHQNKLCMKVVCFFHVNCKGSLLW